MNNKKYFNVGFIAVVIIVGAGVAYYCYPMEINNMIGISTPQSDAIVDDASSSLALDDGSDVDTPTSTPDASVVPAASTPKKAVQKKNNIAVSTATPPTAQSVVAIAQTSSVPITKSVSTTAPVASATISVIAKNAITSSVATSVPISIAIPNNTNPIPPSVAAQNPDVNVSSSASSSLPAEASSTDVASVDDATSATSTAALTPTTTPTDVAGAVVGHILIAAVQIGGASSSNDLVKLYNPTAAAIDVSGWKLHKKSETGTDYSLKEFPAGSTIDAGQFFVWANSTGGFSETVAANVSSTETLAVDNSVALMDATGNIVDAVAWGTGTSQYGEGPPYPTSPGANQLLSRRSSDGMMVDTDNNTNDFTLQ